MENKNKINVVIKKEFDNICDSRLLNDEELHNLTKLMYSFQRIYELNGLDALDYIIKDYLKRYEKSPLLDKYMCAKYVKNVEKSLKKYINTL